MARVYFQKESPGKVVVTGTIITSLQDRLNESNTEKIRADGIFGSETDRALKQYQERLGLPPTGKVDAETWSTLMQTAEPSIFQRCLQLTAHFEGTGFTRIVGNFDGAGLTWGIIGFTLSNGELGSVIKTIAKSHPDIIKYVFGDDAELILEVVDRPSAKRMAWADSISRGPTNASVAEPWRTYFNDLGEFKEVQAIQLARSKDVYWTIARRDADDMGVRSEIDYALMYDIAVQNGGMQKKERREMALSAFKKLKKDTPERRRSIITEIVVKTSAKKWQSDVRKRRSGVSTGRAEVHGGSYELSNWGLLANENPVDIDA